MDHHLILDGYNLIHRARGGFQKGDWPVVFNFFRGLRPMVERFQPVTRVHIVLEGCPKRNIELLPEYKGNRPASDDSFKRQLDAIVGVLGHMPISTHLHPDFEADDTIANLVWMLGNTEGTPPIRTVVSSDSDFTQLLQVRSLSDTLHDSVRVWNWRTKSFLSAPAYDYVTWKALRGDPTDNIPRCPGMNDRTATALAMDANGLALSMSDAVFRASYERNLALVRLDTFTPDEMDGWQVSAGVKDWDAVKRAFEGFGFRSMLKVGTWDKWVATFDGLL